MIGRKSMRSSCKLIGALCALVALAGGPAGCSDEGPQPGTVQIMHWWNAGGEAQAIDALIAECRRQYPSIKVVDASVDGGSSEARLALATRMNQGNPPDTFQANGGWDLMTWVRYDDDLTRSKMAPIDDVAAAWRGQVPLEVLGTVSVGDSDSPDTHVYAVPLNIHRLNTLFYNKEIFERLELKKPSDMRNLQDLFDVAEQIKVKNVGAIKQITPIALGYGDNQEWVLSLLFHENLLAAQDDRGDMYTRLLGPGTFEVFSLELLSLIDDFRTLLSYTNEKPEDLPWDRAMDRVLKGEAAMTIMGDWAKGYADADPQYSDKVGFIPTPGTWGTFVFTTDTFGQSINLDSAQVANTKNLLSVFGSPDGQRIFNEKKGSISARVDVEPSESDARRPTFEAFRDDTIVKLPATSIQAQQVYVDAISAALANFAKNLRDGTATPSEIQHTIKNYRDVLGKSWK